jgi:phage/plasmid-associated DNA primase
MRIAFFLFSRHKRRIFLENPAMREQLMNALKEAMKAKETRKITTIRMVQSAIKDLEIANRTRTDPTTTDGEIASLLSKLVKQREESAKMYDEGGRPELAARSARKSPSSPNSCRSSSRKPKSMS